jgi:hypothetical protein
MKKRILLSAALLLTLTQASNAIVLQTSVIRLLDGVWPAFDGDTFYKMSWLIVKLDAMINGKIINKETKERQGAYTLNNKLYAIKSLAELEQQNLQDQQLQQQLQDLLKVVKKEFIDINKVFIKQIQGHKQFIVKIMQESCQRRDIPNSFMLRWADTPFGQEEDSFDKNMKTFVELNRFLIELRNFLGDLFESCPKGYAQYLEIIKKQKAHGG